MRARAPRPRLALTVASWAVLDAGARSLAFTVVTGDRKLNLRADTHESKASWIEHVRVCVRTRI